MKCLFWYQDHSTTKHENHDDNNNNNNNRHCETNCTKSHEQEQEKQHLTIYENDVHIVDHVHMKSEEIEAENSSEKNCDDFYGQNKVKNWFNLCNAKKSTAQNNNIRIILNLERIHKG